MSNEFWGWVDILFGVGMLWLLARWLFPDRRFNREMLAFLAVLGTAWLLGGLARVTSLPPFVLDIASGLLLLAVGWGLLLIVKMLMRNRGSGSRT